MARRADLRQSFTGAVPQSGGATRPACRFGKPVFAQHTCLSGNRGSTHRGDRTCTACRGAWRALFSLVEAPAWLDLVASLLTLSEEGNPRVVSSARIEGPLSAGNVWGGHIDRPSSVVSLEPTRDEFAPDPLQALSVLPPPPDKATAIELPGSRDLIGMANGRIAQRSRRGKVDLKKSAACPTGRSPATWETGRSARYGRSSRWLKTRDATRKRSA